MRPPRRPLRWPSALTRQAARCSPPQRQPPLPARPPSFPPRWTICAPRLSVCTCPRCRRSGCRRCPPGWCCLPPRNGQNSLRGGSFPPLWAASTTPKTSVSCRWSSTLRRAATTRWWAHRAAAKALLSRHCSTPSRGGTRQTPSIFTRWIAHPAAQRPSRPAPRWARCWTPRICPASGGSSRCWTAC